MKKILVTGASGQLGKCLRDLSQSYPEYAFTFVDRNQLDLEDKDSVYSYFKNKGFDYCINAAAYTNVEKAESDKEKAFQVNAEGVKWISEQCRDKNTVLIHISTDYVFDGKKTSPYIESDPVAPLSVYGASKLKGENYLREIWHKHFIVRTSWLYSQYGHNFLNSILKFAKEGRDLSITTEQLGTPTNANDLAEAIMIIIKSGISDYGTYHFSNDGEATWHDFAKEILSQTKLLEAVKLAKTDYYPTFAQRPEYSILSKEKFKNTFAFPLLSWKQSLTNVIKKLYSI